MGFVTNSCHLTKQAEIWSLFMLAGCLSAGGPFSAVFWQANAHFDARQVAAVTGKIFQTSGILPMAGEPARPALSDAA